MKRPYDADVALQTRPMTLNDGKLMTTNIGGILRLYVCICIHVLGSPVIWRSQIAFCVNLGSECLYVLC